MRALLTVCRSICCAFSGFSLLVIRIVLMRLRSSGASKGPRSIRDGNQFNFHTNNGDKHRLCAAAKTLIDVRFSPTRIFTWTLRLVAGSRKSTSNDLRPGVDTIYSIRKPETKKWKASPRLYERANFPRTITGPQTKRLPHLLYIYETRNDDDSLVDKVDEGPSAIIKEWRIKVMGWRG